MTPEAILSHLHRADGSATYRQNGYTIIGAVNGPIEVQRRDELPSEATIEVNVRPAAGVGSPKERHLETLLHSTLRTIILTRQIPRTLVQITLQIHSLPPEISSQALGALNTSLLLLPHLLHTALLSLLSSSIPLRTTLTSTLVASTSSSSQPASQPSLLLSPTCQDLLRAKPINAIHVFAFDGQGKMVLSESDGKFGFEEWDEAAEMAEEVCCKPGTVAGGVGLDGMDVDVDGRSGENLEQWLREVVRRKVEQEQKWRGS